ncbi:carbohydrate ABC transporter permease [Georgenia phoenicis]|uniref:carbohydrate ABC transporter permease n=1 Tax=unclassified Georgenia TaxID=2626815 RepID=UPI0039AFD7FA
MRVSTGERLGNYVILIVFAAFALAPIITILVTALGPETPQDAATGGPVHWENFARAWEQGRFSEYMRNSLLVAAVVVVSAAVLSIMAGYALGAFVFPGSQVLFYVFLLGIMVPAEAIIVPLFFDFRTLGLTNTIWGIALPQVAQSIAFGTFWMRAYFRGANRSIIEAARLDGAGHHRVLWQVLLPVARPAVVTLVLLTFMWTWNEFLIPLVMSPNAQLRTAPLGLALFQGQYTQGTVLLAAGAVLVALPMVVLYLFLQRHFIRGMLEGAVKD